MTRAPALENAKVLLLALVVAGHALEPLVWSRPGAKAAYVWIYAFHMPVFVAIAGHVSRPWATWPDALRTVVRLLVPLALFQLAYVALDPWVYGRPYDQGPLVPYWLLWFLASLATWRLALPVFARSPWTLAPAVALALGAGLVPAIGRELSLSRTLVFLPFFLAGYFARREWLEALRRPVVRVVAALLLALAALAGLRFAPTFDVRWFYGSLPFDALGLGPTAGAAARAAQLAAGSLLGVAFLALVPQEPLAITPLGRRTLVPYLAHGLVVRAAIGFGWYAEFWGLPATIGLCALTFATPLHRLLAPIVEPGWIGLRAGRRSPPS